MSNQNLNNESIHERIGRIINDRIDLNKFKDVREYIIQNIPAEPSSSDSSLSVEERQIMSELLEIEYNIPKMIADPQWCVKILINAALVKTVLKAQNKHLD